jgi:hypothetical protein
MAGPAERLLQIIFPFNRFPSTRFAALRTGAQFKLFNRFGQIVVRDQSGTVQIVQNITGWSTGMLSGRLLEM